MSGFLLQQPKKQRHPRNLCQKLLGNLETEERPAPRSCAGSWKSGETDRLTDELKCLVCGRIYERSEGGIIEKPLRGIRGIQGALTSIDSKMRDKLVDQLIKHEGLKLKPYHCPAGKLTIGVKTRHREAKAQRGEPLAFGLLAVIYEICEICEFKTKH